MLSLPLRASKQNMIAGNKNEGRCVAILTVVLLLLLLIAVVVKLRSQVFPTLPATSTC